MTRYKKRICTGILAAVMALTGCSGGQSKDVEPSNPISVSETHLLEDTLHKVFVKEEERVFVKDGKSDYKIIAGTDDRTQKAANYLSIYVEKATGCKLELADASAYTADGKFIVMNVPEIFEAAGLTMPEDDLGVQGYYIKTVGDNVIMSSNYESGARFMMLSFLRNVLGFKMYALDAVVFEKDGAIMPDMEITEKPDISYFHRMHNTGEDAEEIYMMGFTTDGFLSIEGRNWHNSLTFLPMETYADAHPEWFSTRGDDLCYTGHGSEQAVDEMTTIIADKILAAAAEQPNALFATCTIMDHNNVCGCDACVASNEQYNGADSAAVIKFTNILGRKVQEGLQKEADATGTKKRPLTVMFFAYNVMVQPPAVKNADGTWSPLDESVVCDDDVAVFYAPIAAQFNHTFYETENQKYYDMLQGWRACSNDLYCWLYETNFMYYMYPYNSWDSMMETYRYCVENGASYVMGQDQHNATGSTSFTDLKDYINSCALFDLNQDYEAILDDYFENYYLDASEPMRRYFDELRAWMRYLEDEYPAELNGSIYAEIAKDKFWPKGTLEHWLDLIDEALEAAENCKSDRVLYENLKKRIIKESLFARYALIEHYSGVYSAETLLEMKLSFREDAQTVGLSRYQEGEGGELDILYEAWGIK